MVERRFHGANGIREIEVDGAEHHNGTHKPVRNCVDRLSFVIVLLQPALCVLFLAVCMAQRRP